MRFPRRSLRVLVAIGASFSFLSLAAPTLARGEDAPEPLSLRVHPTRSDLPAARARAVPVGASIGPDIGTRLRAALAAARNPQDPAALPASAAETAPSLAQRIGRDVSVVRRPGVGTPAQIRGERLQTRMAAAEENDDEMATAREFLRGNRAVLGLKDPDSELVLRHRAKDELGFTHLKFDQRYRGLAVWPAQLSVHLDRDGAVYLLDGAFVFTPRLRTMRPIVDAAGAARRALATASGTARVSKTELIVYAPGSRAPRLAWRVDVEGRPDEAATAVIDAQNGARLATIPRVMTENVTGSGVNLAGNTVPLNVWHSGSTFSLIDTSKAMFDPSSHLPDPGNSRGAIFVLDAANTPPTNQPDSSEATKTQVTSTSSGAWDPADAVSASFNFSIVWDYYKQTHNRNSVDGDGGNVLAVVRLGQNYQNAFWTDSIGGMFFGDGDTWPGALDVVGHELTHGVTSHTAALVYQDQSGALNEAMSDVFGEMVENFYLGSNDWLVGTNLSGPLRDMSDPGRFSQPGTMSEFVQTTDDHGGVHTNSGIINHAYYLLAEGGDSAIGKSDAERIFYRGLTTHLTENSQFLDARLACIQSADEIFGAGSPQSQGTAAAFDEVEILDAAPAPPPPSTPPVAGNDSAVVIYRDGQLFLGRRETALGDPSQGVNLSDHPAAFERPAVSGDGTLAFFVTSDNDACFIPTNGSEAPSCLGLPGQIASVAMSRDATAYAFVLLNAGERDNRISVVDLAADTALTYDLVTPATDGDTAGSVLFADTLEFTANRRFLFYDALTVLTLSDGSEVGVWSISAIDFTGSQTYTVVAPFEGVDIANPAVAKTSDDYLVFEVDDQTTGNADIYTTRLSTGDFVQAVSGIGASGPAPSYSGDDRALVYGYPDTSAATGTSLARIALASDHLSATGQPAPWLFDGAFGVVYRRGGYTAPQGNCTPSSATLCLSGGRFQVEATFTTTQGRQDSGNAVALTADTGYFTFFNPNNVEVVIKVLDACGINGNLWVFAGGLTDVATVLRVTDTVTGVSRTYGNPQSTAFEPVQDTAAFATCFAGARAAAATASGLADAAWGDLQGTLASLHAVKPFAWAGPDTGPRAVSRAMAKAGRSASPAVAESAVAEPNAASSACTPGDGALCLAGGRFRVQSTFRTADNRTGSGHAVGLTADTGYFWFFSPSNVEMVIKVLNACAVNGHYWTFAGGLTDVQVTTTVTDTNTGAVRTYTNALHQPFRPIQDTGAFATCP